MGTNVKHLEMTEADLRDHAPEELACDQCGSGCGYRVARVLDGRAFIMCSRKDATRKVLAAVKPR